MQDSLNPRSAEETYTSSKKLNVYEFFDPLPVL